MEPEKRSRTRRLMDGVTVAVFGLAVGVPLYGFLFDTPREFDENRERYRPPRLTAERFIHAEFTKHFEMYLGDHIGYRDALLKQHRQIVYGVFDDAVSGKAWIGRDGWIYMNQSDPFLMSRKVPGVEARVDAWVDAIAERDAWFRARGIAYIVLIAPDKAAVYPEYLRGYPVRHPPPELGTSAAAELNARGVRCVNLLPAIVAEKSRHPEIRYNFKTDSHWTPDGARAGYAAVAEAVRERFAEFRERPDSDYTFGEVSGGDLRRFAGIREEVPRESTREYVPKSKIDYGTREDYFSAAQKAERLSVAPSLFSVCPSATGPDVLFLNDSFGAFLWPFIAADFKRASNIATYGMPMDAIRIEKPKLVIQLMVARNLYGLSPKNPPEMQTPRP